MNTNIAKKTIQIHAGHLLADNEASLIGDLRPFVSCQEDSFAATIAALAELHPEFGKDQIDRELVYASFDIPNRLRTLIPTLLKRQLIDESTRNALESWSKAIEDFCLRALSGSELIIALSSWMAYVGSETCRQPSLYRTLLPVLQAPINEDCMELNSDRLKAIKSIVNGASHH